MKRTIKRITFSIETNLSCKLLRALIDSVVADTIKEITDGHGSIHDPAAKATAKVKVEDVGEK